MGNRKRGKTLSNNDVKRQLYLAIDDQMSAEMAVLHLMNDFVLILKS